MAPFKFLQPLEILQVVMVHNEVEHSSGLKEICAPASFFRVAPHTIDHVRLKAEEFGVNAGDDTRFAILHRPQNDAFCFVVDHTVS